MAISKVWVVPLAFLVVFILTVLVSRGRKEKDVVIYTIGEEEEIEDDISKLLHVEQVLKKAEADGSLTVVNVEFPHNNLGYIIKNVKILNYNSKYKERDLIKDDKEDDNFWVLVSDGDIDTSSITIEINSFRNIDVDVEFYGYLE